MAKQSGLHQIRGKVGEHSYYRQTGVASGLIRGINQGMSSRVKTGDEYVNTRLNNAEFGQAGRIAKVLGLMITPKYRPMILPFSQSKMAKYLLSEIKNNSAPWGQRNLSSTAVERTLSLVTALNLVAKGDFDGFDINVSSGDLQQIIVAANSPAFDNKLASIGANGVLCNLVFANAVIGRYSIPSVDYANSYALFNVTPVTLEQGGDSESHAADFPAGPGEGTGWMSSKFLVLVLMPFRVVDDQQYILQEHCTFKAMEIPA